MLQIATGKLFSEDPTHQNRLRGVLYSNLLITGEDKIETVAGDLIPTTFRLDSHGELVFEMNECVARAESGIGLVSRGIEPYIRDFALLVSIGFNSICTVSADETLRSTNGIGGRKNGYTPSSFIARVFDPQLPINNTEIESFVKFVNDLISLDRESFLRAMRAIRTYVVALLRLTDDVTLSYTLLVASIESLAQSFSKFAPTWCDYNKAAREEIDEALNAVNDDSADKIRNVLLKFGRQGARTQFREFVHANLDPTFFNVDADGIENPIRKSDLDQMLLKAYDLRSNYIHRLKELPKALTVSIFPGETLQLDDSVQMTIRGLARTARHLTLRFVSEQPKREREIYDYRLEVSGAVPVSFEPRYWVGETKNLTLSAGVKRFEGHIDQLTALFSNKNAAEITDLRPLLSEVERLLDTGNENDRRPFIALYFLYNALLPEEQRMSNLPKIEKKYLSEFLKPSIESMLFHMILQVNPEWDVSKCQHVVTKYLGIITINKQDRRNCGKKGGRFMYLVQKTRPIEQE